MKKILFWISEAVVFILLILWLCFVLNYYNVINLNINLPTLSEDLTNPSNPISDLPGFGTMAEIGSVMLIFGIGLFIVYFGAMLAMYYFGQVSKTAIFWMNITFYSLFLIAFILGILFINLDL